MATNDFNPLMMAAQDPEEFKKFFANALGESSFVKVPTQAQFRTLAHSLNIHNLLDFGFISDEDESLSPAEILTKIQNLPPGPMRDGVWAVAPYFNISIPEGFDEDEDVDLDLDLILHPKDTQTFTLFNKLPIELRDKIWEYAAESNRLVEVIWQKREERWWASKSSQIDPPGVFAACRESREATKFVRERCGISAFGTWTNIYSDLLWINPGQDIPNMRFMNFCMDLYEVWKDPIRSEDDIDDSEDRALSKLPRLAVNWDMLEVLLDYGELDDDLSFGGEEGLLRTNFTGLQELVLVDVEYVRDQAGKLYKDDRLLVEGELLEAKPTEFLTDPTRALEKARENLKFEPGQCEISLKRLQRGNDGEGGARFEYFNRDQSVMGMMATLLAEGEF
ncbi:hypothetical protein BDZ45DRAFT_382034 [Acephala macrosclerotiorum]|nr:hypothetical protein BDZ45DRAFT_382034 [Acephala macrosclerotiorum]